MIGVRSGAGGRRTAAIALSILFFMLALCAPNPCRGEAAILRLSYRNAADVLPLVEGLLSREGRRRSGHPVELARCGGYP